MNSSFVNFSNHPSEKWSKSQRSAAEEYGTIIDIPFPTVRADASEEEIAELAAQMTEEILSCRPAAVMCQGEFTLTFAVVERLKARGVRTFAACSERKVIEKERDDGAFEKTVYFEFVRFREYRF